MNSKVGGEKGIFVGEFRLVLLFWLLVLTFVRISKLQPNTTCYFIVLTGISSNDFLRHKIKNKILATITNKFENVETEQLTERHRHTTNTHDKNKKIINRNFIVGFDTG